MKFQKVMLVLGLMASVFVTGCASVGSVTNKMVNNKSEGVIYGSASIVTDATVKEVCDAIGNKDVRCLNQKDYALVGVLSKFGFADGMVGIHALVKKDFPNLNKLNRTSGTMQDKNAVYVKAKVVAGQLGEVLEIVSTNGEGKCFWSGVARAGGVVCPAYNYDYSKDFNGVVFR